MSSFILVTSEGFFFWGGGGVDLNLRGIRFPRNLGAGTKLIMLQSSIRVMSSLGRGERLIFESESVLSLCALKSQGLDTV